MDTDALRLFVLAAEKLNISAAGRDLGLAPAVSSARLAKLEQTVGADLLHRSTRKVSLSLEGAEFLPFAREILAQEDAALAALGRGDTKPSGTLRFTAPNTFAQLYIAPLLAQFLEQHPKVTLDIRLSDGEFDLIEGSYDLALRNMVLDDTSLKGRKLADDTRILCASPGYLQAHGRPKTVEGLNEHCLIGFKDLLPRGLIDGHRQQGVFDPRKAKARIAIDDGTSQRIATIHGAGISLNSMWSVHSDLLEGKLEQVLPSWRAEAANALWLVYPKSNVLSPKVRVFIDFLIKHCSARSWSID
ncbi:MAG: LysR family transcriptional regulator [Pseudomonadota bacterium]